MFTIILWTRIHDGRLVIRDAEEGFAVVFVTYDANDKKKNRTHYTIWLYIIVVMLHKTIIYTAVDIVHGHLSLGCKKNCRPKIALPFVSVQNPRMFYNVNFWRSYIITTILL